MARSSALRVCFCSDHFASGQSLHAKMGELTLENDCGDMMDASLSMSATVLRRLWDRLRMVGSFAGCCALAANGRAAAPPRSVMNSRLPHVGHGLPPAGHCVVQNSRPERIPMRAGSGGPGLSRTPPTRRPKPGSASPRPHARPWCPPLVRPQPPAIPEYIRSNTTRETAGAPEIVLFSSRGRFAKYAEWLNGETGGSHTVHSLASGVVGKNKLIYPAGHFC